MGKLLNIQIWNPEVYAFDTIPNTMAPWEVTIILIVAILSALLGALVPAIRAGTLSPVEALRWE
jgi:lipoprotein-releasing system permease protein